MDRKEFEAKGVELFGSDKQTWNFVCPACGNTAGLLKAKDLWPELMSTKWSPTSECVGRYLSAIGCDWAAYGLLCGPLYVEMTDENGERKVVYAFDFEGRPFTVEDQDGLDRMKEVTE